jgi:hypothetical protein
MTTIRTENKQSPVFMLVSRVLSGGSGVCGSRRARHMTSDWKKSPDFTLLRGLGVINE